MTLTPQHCLLHTPVDTGDGQDLFFAFTFTTLTRPSSPGHRIFSIKRPRRLFKTWPQGPGVYLKPAFNRGPAFINEVKFSSCLG